MKTSTIFLLSLVVGTSAGATQKSTSTALSASVCAVKADPASFDNKIVSLRATVFSAFEVFEIGAPAGNCGGMWLTYSEGGPVAWTSLMNGSRPERRPISVIRDDNFKRFQLLLNSQMHLRSGSDMCLVCSRYEVSATMVGRVDYAGEDKTGYGHMNGYKWQFELISVSAVSARDVIDRYDPMKYSADPVRLPTGYIEGEVIAPNGMRCEDVRVTATPEGADNEFQCTGEADTDKRGHFKIGVPPGKYVIGVNVIRPASEAFPFRKTYAPAVHDYSSAQVYTVSDGEHVRADIHLSAPLSTRSISVKVEWSDGRPVQNANVWLTEAKGNPYIVVNTAVSHTGADGTFVLKGVADTDYAVHANTYVKPRYVKLCAQDAMVRSKHIPTCLRFVLNRYGAACGE
jgi:hypothetical protein